MYKLNISSRFIPSLYFTLFIFSIFVSYLLIQNQNTIEIISQQKNNFNKTTLKSFNQFPMLFEKNIGQTESKTDFLFSDKILELSISSTKAKMFLRQPSQENEKTKTDKVEQVVMQLANANPKAKAEGVAELITKSNYFIGSDSTKWHTNIPNYEKVKYTEIYPGIDLVYYGKDGKLEYDFNISPGSDPKVIQLQFEKEADVKLDKNGNLILQVGAESIAMQAPIAYQEIDGEHKLVTALFTPLDENTFAFKVDQYDVTKPLVIDPILVYSTHIGRNLNSGNDIAVDTAGYVYITGESWGRVFITKLHPDSSEVLYTTFLDGDFTDIGYGIAVDTAGYVYITGETRSDNFPVFNALQPELNETDILDDSFGDAFVTKLKPDGSSFVYSTYLGGEGAYGGINSGYDIAADLSGNAYITGATPGLSENAKGFPLVNAYQANDSSLQAAFVTKIDPSGSAFIFSTFLSGKGKDVAYGIALDVANNIYITGNTTSDNFPIKNAYQPTGDYLDAFVTKMNPQGSALIYSTYLSSIGNDPNYSYADRASAIAVNELGEVYVVGETYSPYFPTTNAVQPSHGGGLDGFVTKFAADGRSLIFSTYLGGSAYEQDLSIALDKDGNAFVIGNTQSVNFPTEKPIQASLKGSDDVFITGISSDGLNMIFSSYLGGSNSEYSGGGITVGRNGHIYVTGRTGSEDFPIVGMNNNFNYGNAFLAEISLEDEEFYYVKVMQDSLEHKSLPIANTEFKIYTINLENPLKPIEFVEFQTTDKNGILKVPFYHFVQGGPFFIQAQPYSEKTVKSGHNDVDGILYKVFVDNMDIDLNGRPIASLLPQYTGDTVDTYLNHTSIGFNLVVSIEWLALSSYIEGLKDAFENANNYFYDVSNGQAFLNSVVIYDDKMNWGNADIQIFADNTRWPQTDLYGSITTGEYVHLPPNNIGNEKENVKATFYNELINPNNYRNYSTIIHELGHYLFAFYDEYLDVNNNHIYPNDIGTQPDINFGYMDNQYRKNNPMASEMSAFKSPQFNQTKQGNILGPCFEFFRTKFSKTYDGVRAEIHTPKRLGLSAPSLIIGPNDNLIGPEYSVGDMMNIIDKTSRENPIDIVVFAKDKKTGEILSDVKVAIESGYQIIKQGKTILSGDDRGKIRIRGLSSLLDKLLIVSNFSGSYKFYASEFNTENKVIEKIDNRTANSSSSNPNEIIVELQTIQGNFILLPKVLFNENGSLKFSASTNKSFNSPAQLEIMKGDGTNEIVNLTESTEFIIGGSGKPGVVYENDLPDSISQTAMFFKASDSTDNSFFLPINMTLVENVDNNIISLQENIALAPEEVSTVEKYVVATTSYFPIPDENLLDSLRRASSLISLQAFPTDANMGTNMSVVISADSFKAIEPSAIVIYQYKNDWQPLPTNVNIEYGIASASISEPGFYMVFLDETKSIVGVKESPKEKLPTKFGLKQNYPNPFNPTTTIKYSIPIVERLAKSLYNVTLKVYDVLGREVATLVNKEQSTGNYEVDFNASSLTSGIYFYRLKVGNEFVETKKMLLLK